MRSGGRNLWMHLSIKCTTAHAAQLQFWTQGDWTESSWGDKKKNERRSAHELCKLSRAKSWIQSSHLLTDCQLHCWGQLVGDAGVSCWQGWISALFSHAAWNRKWGCLLAWSAFRFRIFCFLLKSQATVRVSPQHKAKRFTYKVKALPHYLFSSVLHWKNDKKWFFLQVVI